MKGGLWERGEEPREGGVTFSEYMEGVLPGLSTTMLGPACVWIRFPP